MKRHWNYLKYVIKHKWFVLLAAYRINASWWLAIIHDRSKFLPSEWIPYAHTFYASNGDSQYKETPEFNQAWLIHQHRNPHHWQYWVLRQDNGPDIALEMPRRYALEMISDWMGAGRAITGEWDVVGWYNRNHTKMKLHPRTRALVEDAIGSYANF